MAGMKGNPALNANDWSLPDRLRRRTRMNWSTSQMEFEYRETSFYMKFSVPLTNFQILVCSINAKMKNADLLSLAWSTVTCLGSGLHVNHFALYL